MLQRREIVTDELLLREEQHVGTLMSAHLCRPCFAVARGRAPLRSIHQELGWITLAPREDQGGAGCAFTVNARRLTPLSLPYFQLLSTMISGDAAGVLAAWGLVVVGPEVAVRTGKIEVKSFGVWTASREATARPTPISLGEFLLIGSFCDAVTAHYEGIRAPCYLTKLVESIALRETTYGR